MIRKILFRLLIVIAVGLIALLGTAFYKKVTPLSILQGIFQHSEPKNDDSFNTNRQRDIIKEKLKAAAENNTTTGDETSTPSTGNTDTSTTTSTNSDKKDTQNLVNSLVDNAQ